MQILMTEAKAVFKIKFLANPNHVFEKLDIIFQVTEKSDKYILMMFHEYNLNAYLSFVIKYFPHAVLTELIPENGQVDFTLTGIIP